jgi:SAM-dependent methyltransferase
MVYSKDDVVDTFDLITCIHVMEHMPEPIKELEWMLSKLNPGGTILLELPTAMSPTMAHLYVPSRKGLEIMLNNLNLDYVYLPHDIVCNILIGDNFSNYSVQKVYYTYESPDFDTKAEVHNWLKNSYDAKG